MTALKHVLAAGLLLCALSIVPGSGAVWAQSQDAEVKADEYIDTARPTKDGTIHPNGQEAKPREQWFSPCPPDRRLTMSGDCEPLRSAAARNESAAGTNR